MPHPPASSPPLRCLVTGGAGFIGSHLVEALVGLGHQVRVLDNFSSGKRRNLSTVKQEIELFAGNIRSKEELWLAAEGMDVIYHEAALPSVTISVKDPQINHITNINGTLNVLEAARQLGVKKVVLASSAAVYGSHPAPAKNEGLPTKPVSPYGLAKLVDEQYAELYHQLYGLDTICLRYFNVFGPRQNPTSQYSGVISIFVNKVLAEEGLAIYGDGQQSRDFVPVSEVVRANLRCIQPDVPPHGIYNVGLGQRHSLLDLVRLLEEVTQQDIPLEFREERRGDIRDSLADISLIQRELGFKPQQGFAEAFKAFVRYEQAHRQASASLEASLEARHQKAKPLTRQQAVPNSAQAPAHSGTNRLNTPPNHQPAASPKANQPPLKAGHSRQDETLKAGNKSSNKRQATEAEPQKESL